ncbi:MAG: hypothetical protein BWK79_02505 [Beggiatoa sp. IS2]|nr:MAG: hypothetical protein BWK79_02505 [Beggiatoa sp. IS2]
MKLEDFNNLDPKNVGNWPIPVKAVITILIFAAALGAGYYFDTQEQLLRLEKVQKTEGDLREEFKTKQWKAAALPMLKRQLVEIEKNLEEFQRQLPNKAEVAGLIQDISQQAIASGLKSELFEPAKEKIDQVYVEYPIKLQLSGDYHSFGKFISGIAAMPRIVTQHDVSIVPKQSGDKKGQQLLMSMTAKIYRYLDESEEKQKAAEQKAAEQKNKPATPPAAPPAKK